jgi:arginine deiminase
MEITTAQNIIKSAITNATNNLQALQIASDLLNNTYSAQFTALENAQKEANDLSLELNEKTKECATLSDSLTTANDSIADLQNIVIEKSKEATSA